jgi:hypothetical protein
MVVETIKQMYKKLKAPVSNKARKQKLLELLRVDNVDTCQRAIKDPYPKTCRWILRTSPYRDWLDPDKRLEHHGFLWIIGKPASGKSTLTKFILNNAQKTMNNSIIISFFFSARGVGQENCTIVMYQSLLLQLLQQLPILQDELINLIPQLRQEVYFRWDIRLLKFLLEHAIRNLRTRRLLCLIDALDVCNEHEIIHVWSFFEKLGAIAIAAGTQFNVLFSSRHHPPFGVGKCLEFTLESQEGHTQDIAEYVRSRLSIKQDEFAKKIHRGITKKSAGIFLWAVVAVATLKREHANVHRENSHKLQRMFNEMPSGLNELFYHIMTRSSDNRGQMIPMIQWMLYARRPLNLAEFYVTLSEGVRSKVRRWEPETMRRSELESIVSHASNGFAQVNGSKNLTVTFSHQSVEDFLLNKGGLGKIWPGLKDNPHGQSHERLKTFCLNYINISITNDRSIKVFPSIAALPESEELRLMVHRTSPFLEYAVMNVLFHAEKAAERGIGQEKFLNAFRVLDWVKLNNLFETFDTYKYTADSNLLYILAQQDLSSLIAIHPNKSKGFDVINAWYGTPIFAALATRSYRAARALFAAHAQSPSHIDVAEGLFTQVDEPNPWASFSIHKLSKERGVLSYIAEYCNEAVLKYVLEVGLFHAQVGSADTPKTPLWFAVRRGFESAAQKMLDIAQKKGESKQASDTIKTYRVQDIISAYSKTDPSYNRTIDGQSNILKSLSQDSEDRSIMKALKVLTQDQHIPDISTVLPWAEDIDETEIDDSDIGSLIDRMEVYMEFFANEVLAKAGHELKQWDQNELEQQLQEGLDELAIRLGYSRDSKLNRDVMYVAHKACGYVQLLFICSIMSLIAH